MTCSSPALILLNSTKSCLNYMGNLDHYFLRIEVIRTLECILISHRHYVLNMLFKFGMTDCKSVSTPLDRNIKLCHESTLACDDTQFRRNVRSLIYLTITRPDLSYPIGLISQIMSKPTTDHLHCALRMMCYASSTRIVDCYIRQL